MSASTTLNLAILQASEEIFRYSENLTNQRKLPFTDVSHGFCPTEIKSYKSQNNNMSIFRTKSSSDKCCFANEILVMQRSI